MEFYSFNNLESAIDIKKTLKDETSNWRIFLESFDILEPARQNNVIDGKSAFQMIRREKIVFGAHYFIDAIKSRMLFGGINSQMTEIHGIFYGKNTEAAPNVPGRDELAQKNHGLFIARKEPGYNASFITFRFKFANGYHYKIVINDKEGLLLPLDLLNTDQDIYNNVSIDQDLTKNH